MLNAKVKQLNTLSIGNSNEQNAEDLLLVKAYMFGKSQVGYVHRQYPSLHIHAVPKRRLEAVKKELVKMGWLERIVQWVKSLETASSVIRDVDRKRELHYRNGAMCVLDEAGKKVELP